MKQVRSKIGLSRILVYLFVGGLTFLTEYGSFIVLYYVCFVLLDGLNLIASQVVSFCLAMIVNFIGNYKVTFQTGVSGRHRYTPKIQVLMYVTLALGNLFIASVIMYVLVHDAHIHPLIAKFIAMLTTLSWSYLFYKRVIFKKE